MIREKLDRYCAAFLIALALTAPAWGAASPWQSITLTEDREGDTRTIEKFCLVHDLTLDDILWANNCAAEDLAPGKVLYLPRNQAEMMNIWQQQGAWKPKALVKTTSAAAAQRAQGASGVKPVTPPLAVSQAPKAAAAPQPKPAPAPDPQLKAKAPDPAPSPKAGVDADPVLVLSPEGDSHSGPMRLVVSGGKIEVIRMPKSASPKRPSMADLNNAFPPSLLPPLPQRNFRDEQISAMPKNGKMIWPVDGAVSSPFGRRGSRKHDGVDIPMPPGTPIRAARSGVVAKTGDNNTAGFRGYGNFVLLDHGGGVKTLYAHCSKVTVKPGQIIRQGDYVATVGRTGRASTDHVHFEVRINNQAVNPLPYLAPRTTVARKK